MNKAQLLLLVFLSLNMGISSAQVKKRKVLFIGIDGVRSDALQQANTPNLDAILANGIYTYDSWHLGITSSGPSWSTMLTGVWEAKHKITNNSYTGADFGSYPYFPTRAKEIDPTLKAIQIITWNPMDDADKNTGGNVFNASWDKSIDAGDLGQGLVTAAAKIQLLDPDVDILFIHYDETDAAGHGFGFSPNVPQYMAAIEDVDSQIGEVIAALEGRSTYAQEDWMIMGTTDHGGNGTGHGGNSNNERQIWWYASGDNIPNLEITGPDPGSYQMPSNPVDPAILANTPVQADIAATALDWVLPTIMADTVQSWDLDGQSWLPDSISVIDTSTTTSVHALAHSFSIYPNPTQERLTILRSGDASPVSVFVHDAMGRPLLQARFEQARFQVDVSPFSPGLYLLSLRDPDSGKLLGYQNFTVLR